MANLPGGHSPPCTDANGLRASTTRRLNVPAGTQENPGSQHDYAVSVGVPNPTLYVYEAFGQALSHGPAFVSQYSPGVVKSDVTFGSAAWLDIFGYAPTTDLIKFVTDHVDFYEAIYRASGTLRGPEHDRTPSQGSYLRADYRKR